MCTRGARKIHARCREVHARCTRGARETHARYTRGACEARLVCQSCCGMVRPAEPNPSFVRTQTQASSSKPQLPRHISACTECAACNVHNGHIMGAAVEAPSQILVCQSCCGMVRSAEPNPSFVRTKTQASSSKPQAATSYQRLRRRMPVPINFRHNTKDESPRVRNESTQV